jgi:peptidoglycan/xylan/chitin deacetylase (PgdA/CDA1 family)
MDKRRRPNPKLRLAVLALIACMFVAMTFTMARSAAHTEVVRPTIEVSSLPREIALDIAGSNAIYISPNDQRVAIARLRKAKAPLYCGGTKKYAAISFDDGPSATTSQLVELLADAGIPATFFDLGRNANSDPQNLRLQGDYGPVANHSWDHADFTTLSRKDLKTQLTDTQDVIRQGTGQDWKMMRPPYGARDEQTIRLTRKLGFSEMLWSADSQDALGKPWQAIAKNAIDGLGPGAMILFHDGPAATLQAFKKKLIPAFRRSDITFVTVPDLLVLNPPSDAQLAAGPMGCAHAGRVNVSGGSAVGGYLANPEAR